VETPTQARCAGRHTYLRPRSPAVPVGDGSFQECVPGPATNLYGHASGRRTGDHDTWRAEGPHGAVGGSGLAHGGGTWRAGEPSGVAGRCGGAEG
jgi:hypothetical protein